MIKSIPLSYKITGTKINIPFKAICSITNKEFGGEVIIEYHPSNKALEYVHAEKVINHLSGRNITAEDLVHLIYQEVIKSIRPNYLKVMVDVKYSKAHKPVQVWLES